VAAASFTPFSSPGRHAITSHILRIITVHYQNMSGPSEATAAPTTTTVATAVPESTEASATTVSQGQQQQPQDDTVTDPDIAQLKSMFPDIDDTVLNECYVAANRNLAQTIEFLLGNEVCYSAL
jgi:predicted secreted acid phosphatase